MRIQFRRGVPWYVVVASTCSLLAGLALSTAVVIFYVKDAQRKENLRAVGLSTVATVVDRVSRRSGDRTELVYEVNNDRYHRWVTGYIGAGTVEILVDPADPTSFLTATGHTDQSQHPLLDWDGPLFAVLFTGAGSVGLFRTPPGRWRRGKFHPER